MSHLEILDKEKLLIELCTINQKWIENYKGVFRCSLTHAKRIGVDKKCAVCNEILQASTIINKILAIKQ